MELSAKAASSLILIMKILINKSEYDSIINEEQYQIKNIFKVGGRFMRMEHNRQQRLFYLGRWGIAIIKYYIKGMFQLMLALATFTILFLFKWVFMSNSELERSSADIYLNFLTLLWSVCCLVGLYPKIWFIFMQATSIQMMKKKWVYWGNN